MADSRISQQLYIDPSISLDDLSGHELIVEIHNDSLLFAIYEPNAGIFMGCGQFTSSTPGALNVVLESQGWLRGKTLETKILTGNAKNTILPSGLFKGTFTPGYLDFNYGQDEKAVTFIDELPSQLSKNIFALPYPLFLLVSKAWPGSPVNHVSTFMIECLPKNATGTPGAWQVVAYIHPGSIAILSFKGEDLAFFNTFEYRTDEDALFYLLVVIDQLGLDPSSLELVLCGHVFKGDPVYVLFTRYIKQVRFADLPDLYYSRSLKNIPGHLYVNLLYRATCGS